MLGDYEVVRYRFDDLDGVFTRFKEPSFQERNAHYKYDVISRVLLELIEKAPNGFLLGAVIEFIDRIRIESILSDYTFLAFELWLNQFSLLSDEDNRKIRGKIVGRYLPRDAYQPLFPIGMGKQYGGTHFVAAHTSPDLDTTVASFWGYLDAFAARVTKDLHIWNVPGGLPKGVVEVEMLFPKLFGEGISEYFAKTRSALTVTCLDLLTQEGVVRKHPYDPSLSFDHDRQNSAVVLVDDEGYYLGDWRSMDVEGVRHVMMLFNNSLSSFEGYFHKTLIALFAKGALTPSSVSLFRESILQLKVKDWSKERMLTLREGRYLEAYLTRVLHVKKGVESTFAEWIKDLSEIADFSLFTAMLAQLETIVPESSPMIFTFLVKMTTALEEGLAMFRNYVDQLGVSLLIKKEVFELTPRYLSQKTELEEIRTKMGSYPYLTVGYMDESDRLIPAGVVYAVDLQKKKLGTVTLRDFSNREEVKIPSFLEVISLIDHHKMSLQTSGPLTARLTDYQSSNSMLAELSFAINDEFGSGGVNEKELDRALERLKEGESLQELRLKRRLIDRKIAGSKGLCYFVAKEREFIEYLHYVYAILDDTDLLTKASRADLLIMASLLNRLKSLSLGEEVEIIHFDALSDDPHFLKKGARLLLQNLDFYSLYSKVYAAKEERVESCLKTGEIFEDTKTVNGFSRVGQMKIFAKNYPTYQKQKAQLRTLWAKREDHEGADLFLQMISTIASADELFKGDVEPYSHRDELWIRIKDTDTAQEHLAFFLNAFHPFMEKHPMEVEFYGENTKEMVRVFKDNFPTAERSLREGKSMSMAVLYYPAGALNSRKAQIAPYLPMH